MKVRVNGQLVKAIPDSGAALSVISKKLADQLNVKISNAGEAGLSALGNPLTVIGVVANAPISIATAKIPIDLRVVNTSEETLLLGMDWFQKYNVNLNTPAKELTFKSQGNSFKTYVEFDKVTKPSINLLTVVEEDDPTERGWDQGPGLPLED
jgi:hypothetical protein